jgi:hypothetical protein
MTPDENEKTGLSVTAMAQLRGPMEKNALELQQKLIALYRKQKETST